MYTFHHYSLTAHLFRKPGHDTYLAYPIDDPGHRVVLKVFDAACLAPETTLSDFRQMEMRLQGLKHPHIVAVLELGIKHGRPYLASEYQPRGSLRQYLGRRASGHLSVEEAVGVVMQVGQATAFAHAHGMLHQAIRPENILLSEEGKVLLTDFRVGSLIEKPRSESSSDRRVESYQAPEQVTGAASAASDQYALGCLLYELMTGFLPDPPVLRQHAMLNMLVAPTMLPMLPRQVEAVILRTLAMNPRERYPDVATLLATLNPAIQPEPPTPPFAHLTAPYQFPPLTLEMVPLLQPIPPTIAPDKHPSQELPALKSLEAFLTIPEWDGTSLLDRLAIADGQEDVFILSGASEIGIQSKEHLPIPRFEEQKVGETNPLMEIDLANLLGPDLLTQLQDQDRTVWQEEPLVAGEEEEYPAISVVPEKEEKVVDVVQIEEPVEERALHANLHENSQKAPEAPQSSIFVKKQRKMAVLAWPDWTRPVVLLGAILMLTIISALLGYSLNTRVVTVTRGGSLAIPSMTIVDTAPAATPKASGTSQPSNKSKTALPGNAAPTVPALPVTKSPVPQPTSTAKQSLPPIVPTATPMPHGIGSVRIDAGGSGAGLFGADGDYSSTTSGRPSSSSHISSAISVSGVSNPAPESVYQSARVGDCLYTIANLTPGASYTIRLHFAEIYWSRAGERTFNVFVNNQLVLSNFDIVATTGGEYTAVVEAFVVPASNNGVITIQFATVKNNALINGIEVLAV